MVRFVLLDLGRVAETTEDIMVMLFVLVVVLKKLGLRISSMLV